MQSNRRLDPAILISPSRPMLADRLSTLVNYPSAPNPPSPLMLSDRLLTLAQDAESAGCVGVAGRLLALAHAVLDPIEDGSSAPAD